MAENPSNGVTWILEIDQQHLEYLAPIRHWQQLRLAADQGICWIRGLTEEQLDTHEVRSIPFKRIFYEKDNRLFPAGSLLPVRRMPTSLLWTPLERSLPLSLPSFNHNYFGIHDPVAVRLAASDVQQPSTALLTPLVGLEQYVLTAPAVRLQPLNWVIIGSQALVLGAPLLPLPGDTWWRKDHSLMPAGYDFEWDMLATLAEENLTDGGTHWLLWDKDGGYLPIPMAQCQPLSRSSMRLTMAALSNHPHHG